MKISIAIPVYDMPKREYFLKRCVNSIKRQTYPDYEIVISENGRGMAANANEAIRKCTGDIVKILFMDDYLAHPNALQEIADNFKGNWLVTGCVHDNGKEIYHKHFPTYNDKIQKGINTIGSPSVLSLKKGLEVYFDEDMMWLLDCDLYKRLYDKYGAPDVLNTLNVVIGIGEHQTTNIIGEDRKLLEHRYMEKKWA